MIKRFLIIYIAEKAIPHFKKKKAIKYVDTMQSFTIDELKNSKSSQNCWDEFFDLTKKVQQEGIWKYARKLLLVEYLQVKIWFLNIYDAATLWHIEH